MKSAEYWREKAEAAEIEVTFLQGELSALREYREANTLMERVARIEEVLGLK